MARRLARRRERREWGTGEPPGVRGRALRWRRWMPVRPAMGPEMMRTGVPEGMRSEERLAL